jgi:hypothetical protein
MSGSDRGKHSPAGLIWTALVALVAVAAYWAMFYDMGYQSGQNERKANVEAEHYASDTANQIDRECSAKAGQPARECIAKIVKAERESQRSESDLAAQWKAADWVMWAGILAGAQLLATAFGLYFVKRTLDATLQAVEDTGKATQAMERQNSIAEAAQRAWVALSMVPKLVRRRNLPEGNRLYFRLDFVAENVGSTLATHFEMERALLFMGQGETGKQINERMLTLLAKWRLDYDADEAAVLLPGDQNVGSIWDEFGRPELKAWHVVGVESCQPMCLCAVFYRTVNKPEVVQFSWRSWYLHQIDEMGSAVTIIELQGPELRQSDLCAEPFFENLVHEEYPANDDSRHHKGD